MTVSSDTAADVNLSSVCALGVTQHTARDWKMAWWVRALASLPEDPGFVPSTHISFWEPSVPFWPPWAHVHT